ncbi:MAG: DUF6125 family protein [Candidatus Nezhaarchaeota archaeon]|nr:DUF6125 family protein [Candidatus Nezhaarchaeota archaeon]
MLQPRLQGEELVKWLREAYFTLDGLWFLALEDRLGLERAVEVDVEVWRRFAQVMAKRVARRIRVDSSDVREVACSLYVLFDIEGWEVSLDPSRPLLQVERCPWWDYLNRVGRLHVAKYVCPRVCEAIFGSWTKALNPKVELVFTFTPPRCRAELCMGGGVGG